MKKDISATTIKDRIFWIRGKKVMLDRDLAELYGTQTRVLMQAVKRNQDRFPKDFMFELSREEITGISQFVISLKFSKNVCVFTEQGIAMLSSVLRSKRAVQVNIAIMRAFVVLREMLETHRELSLKLRELEGKVGKHGEDIQLIFQAIQQLLEQPEAPKRQIGFYRGE